MNRSKQERRGYYDALRQNRKILNKRLNKLDAEINLLTGQKNRVHSEANQLANQKNRVHSEANQLADSRDSINSIIKTVKEAGWWKRFIYFFSGDIKTLSRA